MNVVRWMISWLALRLLKSSLAHRLKGTGRNWLQPYQAGPPVMRDAFLYSCCAGKKVFHLGFADAPFTREKLERGELLHSRLLQVSAALYGTDTDADAVAMYRSLTGDEQVAACRLEEVEATFLQQYDLVLAGELLEHLPDPAEFIKVLAGNMRAGQELVVSVPSYAAWDNLAAALQGTESVHPDHEWYFSPYTLQKKFPVEQWEVVQLMPAFYGAASGTINLVKRAFPGLADCWVLIVKRR